MCGAGCLDHFYESDTYMHCWEALRQILVDEDCWGIMLDLGAPVVHGEKRYIWYIFGAYH